MSNNRETYILPIVGLLMIVVPFVRDLGSGDFAIGPVHAWIVLVGLAIAVLGFIFPIRIVSGVMETDPKTILTVVLATLGALVIGDVALNAFMPPMHPYARYGWKIPENRSSTREIEDTAGNYRQVVNNHYRGGFKRWGDLSVESRRLLIIGDSMTEMNYVNDGEEWYAFLEDAFPDHEFFVFGGSGYGTLQEYLVLDDYYDEIRPDTLLWQFCGNDYENNLYALDRFGYPRSNHAVRPYLENGEIVYRLPLPLARAREYSLVIDRLMAVYDRNQWEAATADRGAYDAEEETMLAALSEEQRQEFDRMWEEGRQVTEEIFAMVRQRTADSEMFLFNACDPLSVHEQAICDSLDITCISGVYEHVTSYERRGLQVSVENDGHWNKDGNMILGEMLRDYFLAARERGSG